MNDDLPELLRRFREDELALEDWHRLNEHLDRREGREALRHDWFLEAALPQSLAAAAVAVRIPRPSPARRLLAWIAGPPSPEPALATLRLWSRVSFAALAFGLATATWAVWPSRETSGPEFAGVGSDPSSIARLMLQNQLPDEP
jgi:hypothetical protein